LLAREAEFTNVLVIFVHFHDRAVICQVFHSLESWFQNFLKVARSISIEMIARVLKADGVPLPVFWRQLHTTIKQSLLLLKEQSFVGEGNQNRSLPWQSSSIEINIKVFREILGKWSLSQLKIWRRKELS
jgi:hypothetical protein